MKLDLVRFREEHYPEYASWFADPELDRHLGPTDQDWLDAVLSEPEADGITWAVFRGDELVAVVETAFDPQNRWPAAFLAVAVKPALRRQGVGTAALQLVLALHKQQGRAEHTAYVSVNNPAARRFMEKVGFVATASEPNEHGYIKYGHRQ